MQFIYSLIKCLTARQFSITDQCIFVELTKKPTFNSGNVTVRKSVSLSSDERIQQIVKSFILLLLLACNIGVLNCQRRDVKCG